MTWGLADVRCVLCCLLVSSVQYSSQFSQLSVICSSHRSFSFQPFPTANSNCPRDGSCPTHLYSNHTEAGSCMLSYILDMQCTSGIVVPPQRKLRSSLLLDPSRDGTPAYHEYGSFIEYRHTARIVNASGAFLDKLPFLSLQYRAVTPAVLLQCKMCRCKQDTGFTALSPSCTSAICILRFAIWHVLRSRWLGLIFMNRCGTVICKHASIHAARIRKSNQLVPPHTDPHSATTRETIRPTISSRYLSLPRSC